MIQFFYSLFRAIVTGWWAMSPQQPVVDKMNLLLNRTGTLIMNALGGNFETLQTFTLVDEGLTAIDIFACVATIITLSLVCALTFKLVKMVFSIFFGGR